MDCSTNETNNKNAIKPNRPFNKGRRRSLSGSDVPTKPVVRNRIILGFKQQTARLRQFIQLDSTSSNDTSADLDSSQMNMRIISGECENGDCDVGDSSFDMFDSPSSAHSGHPSNQNNTPSGRSGARLSTTSRLKHYLSEHIVKSHSVCHRPEFHNSSSSSSQTNKKSGDAFNISIDSYSTGMDTDVFHPPSSFDSNCSASCYTTTPTSYISEMDERISHGSRARPKSITDCDNEFSSSISANNTRLTVTNVVDQIRHISVSGYNSPTDQPKSAGIMFSSSDHTTPSFPIFKHKSTSACPQNRVSYTESTAQSNPLCTPNGLDLSPTQQQHHPALINTHSNGIHSIDLSGPYPEPNPMKMPKIDCQSSIIFSPKSLLVKNKRQRLSHSLSYDPQYRLSDASSKYSSTKKLSSKNPNNICLDFSPDRDKWERKISGYLQTSTPTGATLTAINFGLKRVTESEKYLMITKSPGSTPKEFLEDGIKHVEAACDLFASLLKHSSCYDLMPDSGKIVIVDCNLTIGKAVEALEDNVVRAAPIWSSSHQDYCGLLTVYDIPGLLLFQLQHEQENEIAIEEAANSPSTDFCDISVDICLKSLRTSGGASSASISHVSPESSLMNVTKFMTSLSRQLIMVADVNRSGNPLYLLTGLQILRYLHMQSHYWIPELDHILDHVHISALQIPKINCVALSPLPDDTNTDAYSSPLPSPQNTRVQYTVEPSASMQDVLRSICQSFHPCCVVVNPCSDTTANSNQIISEIITISDILHMIRLHNNHIKSDFTLAQLIHLRQVSPMTFRDPIATEFINSNDKRKGPLTLQHLFDCTVRSKASFLVLVDELGGLMNLLSPLDILNLILSHNERHHRHHHQSASTATQHQLHHTNAMDETEEQETEEVYPVNTNVNINRKLINSFVSSVEESSEDNLQMQSVS